MGRGLSPTARWDSGAALPRARRNRLRADHPGQPASAVEIPPRGFAVRVDRPSQEAATRLLPGEYAKIVVGEGRTLRVTVTTRSGSPASRTDARTVAADARSPSASDKPSRGVRWTITRAVALGFSVHTGWAALVAVSGSGRESRVLDRAGWACSRSPARRARTPPSRVPCRSRAAPRGRRAIGAQDRATGRAPGPRAMHRSRGRGSPGRGTRGGRDGHHRTRRRPRRSLEAILRSHDAVHAAEGALYRAVIRGASEDLGLGGPPGTGAGARPAGGRALGAAEGRRHRVPHRSRASARPAVDRGPQGGHPRCGARAGLSTVRGCSREPGGWRWSSRLRG